MQGDKQRHDIIDWFAGSEEEKYIKYQALSLLQNLKLNKLTQIFIIKALF